MAAQRKPPVKKVKFELTRSGIAGIGIVLFCIFLWMFLFGVWTGQSLLLRAPDTAEHVAAEAGAAGGGENGLLHIEAEVGKKLK